MPQRKRKWQVREKAGIVIYTQWPGKVILRERGGRKGGAKGRKEEDSSAPSSPSPALTLGNTASSAAF